MYKSNLNVYRKLTKTVAGWRNSMLGFTIENSRGLFSAALLLRYKTAVKSVAVTDVTFNYFSRNDSVKIRPNATAQKQTDKLNKSGCCAHELTK